MDWRSGCTADVMPALLPRKRRRHADIGQWIEKRAKCPEAGVYSTSENFK
jgi:hypothetical protein